MYVNRCSSTGHNNGKRQWARTIKAHRTQKLAKRCGRQKHDINLHQAKKEEKKKHSDESHTASKKRVHLAFAVVWYLNCCEWKSRGGHRQEPKETLMQVTQWRNRQKPFNVFIVIAKLIFSCNADANGKLVEIGCLEYDIHFVVWLQPCFVNWGNGNYYKTSTLPCQRHTQKTYFFDVWIIRGLIFCKKNSGICSEFRIKFGSIKCYRKKIVTASQSCSVRVFLIKAQTECICNYFIASHINIESLNKWNRQRNKKSILWPATLFLSTGTFVLFLSVWIFASGANAVKC